MIQTEVRRRRRKGIEIVRLMEEERERRIGRHKEQRASRKGKGGAEKRKQELVEEPYFARSSAGVQILNRILDECISLTRLRPVSTEGPEAGGGRGSEGWLRRRGERVGLNAIINLCLALRQWAGWRKRKEGFKLRPTYAARILSNGSRPKSGLIRQENGFREHSANEEEVQSGLIPALIFLRRLRYLREKSTKWLSFSSW